MNASTPIPTTFIPLTPHLRRRIEETVELLVAILDAFDGDPDLEADSGCEPEQDAGDGRELEEDFEEDAGDLAELEGDFEPDQGWENPLAENHRCVRLGPSGAVLFGNSEDDGL